MKKIKLIALPLAAALCIGTVACTTAEDEAPEILGVADNMCAVGAVYDLIDGVAALDKEDGDITPKLQISVNGEPVEGFYTHFDYEDDYEVEYKVTDSKGHVATETAVVSAIARDVYKSFDLVDFDGFEVKTAGSAKIVTQSVIGDGADSKYTVKVAGAAADGDAVLTRGYSLKSGKEYTFKYYLKSNAAGTAKAKVGDGDTIDLPVVAGDNELTFTYSVPESEHDKTDVKVDVLFGSLGADIEWVFDKVVAEYPESGATELAGADFTFKSDKLENRDNHAKAVGVENDGKSVYVETNGTYEIWQEGVFINTEIPLLATNDYQISFDIECENDGEFEIQIQHMQWGPGEFLATIYNGDINKHGKNTVTISNVPAKDNTLWFFIQSGTNANKITLSNLSVKSTPKTGTTELAGEGFTFKSDKLDNRDGHAKAVGVENDGKSVFVETNGTYDIWQEGVFINTEIPLSSENEYQISFDIECENDGEFEIQIQHSQWGPDEFLKTLYNGDINKHGKNTVNISNVPANKENTLWIFIQSGTNANKITLSNLSVQCTPKGTVGIISQTFTCKNVFKMFAYEGAPNYVQWIDGKLIFEVENFSDTDWHNKIESPQFDVDTAGVRFMISFKVKASAPVLCTWVGPKSGAWDPNLIWRQFNLPQTETVMTFEGNESDSSTHQFEWQFGFASNKKYNNVKIEISDIVIYWKDGLLDG